LDAAASTAIARMASLYYGVGDSALNASPFSLTDKPTEKPEYLQNSFGGSVGGR